MKRTNWPFAVLCALLVVLLSLSARTINARDADTADKQCINKCRARYDNCIQLKQLSQSECQGIYQDCTRISYNRAGAVIKRPLCE